MTERPSPARSRTPSVAGRLARRAALTALLACGLAGAGLADAGFAAEPISAVVPSAVAKPVNFIAHRAIYDLSLSDARGSSSVESVRGRIVYDFSGNACQGYALKFRQVTEMGTSGGGSNLSDLRSTTFEDGVGKSFRFTSQNYLNNRLDTSVDGHADRTSAGPVDVALKKPKTASFELPDGVVFPTGQMQAIIAAAEAGQNVFESRIYDGSDGGQKVYSTLAVIGKPIDPAKPREGAAIDRKELDGVTRWPVTISYFDPARSGPGEETPVYSLSFDLYANGISGNIRLDYGDFSLKGVMTSLDFLPQAACNP